MRNAPCSLNYAAVGRLRIPNITTRMNRGVYVVNIYLKFMGPETQPATKVSRQSVKMFDSPASPLLNCYIPQSDKLLNTSISSTCTFSILVACFCASPELCILNAARTSLTNAYDSIVDSSTPSASFEVCEDVVSSAIRPERSTEEARRRARSRRVS